MSNLERPYSRGKRTTFCGALSIALGAALLSGCGGGAELVPPLVGNAPADITVAEGSMAAFTVVPLIEPNGLSFEWSVDGLAVTASNTAALSWGPVQLGDDGKVFTAELSNPLGRVTSAGATLTVTPRAWTAPVNLGDADAGVRETRPKPLLAVAGNGRVYALITRFDQSTRSTLWLARKDAGQEAFTIVRLVRGGGTGAADGLIREMALAADAAGRAVMVWREEARGLTNTSSIWVSVEGADSAGTSGRIDAQRLSSVNAEFAAEPSVAAIAAGGFEVVWAEQAIVFQTSRIVGRRLTFNAAGTGSFSAAQPTDLGDADSFSPQIASDEQGNTTLVWQGRLGANSNGFGIFANRRAAGTTSWRTPATRCASINFRARQAHRNCASTPAVPRARSGTRTRSSAPAVFNGHFASPGSLAKAETVAQWYGFQEPAFALCPNDDVAIVSLRDGFDGQRLYHWRYDAADGSGTWGAPSSHQRRRWRLRPGQHASGRLRRRQQPCGQLDARSPRSCRDRPEHDADLESVAEVRARRFIAGIAPHHPGQTGWADWLAAQTVRVRRRRHLRGRRRPGGGARRLSHAPVQPRGDGVEHGGLVLSCVEVGGRFGKWPLFCTGAASIGAALKGSSRCHAGGAAIPAVRRTPLPRRAPASRVRSIADIVLPSQPTGAHHDRPPLHRRPDLLPAHRRDIRDRLGVDRFAFDPAGDQLPSVEVVAKRPLPRIDMAANEGAAPRLQ